MRFAIPTLLVLFMAVAAAAAPEPDVGSMYRKKCAPCHELPDKALATDRAWLDQIRRTT